MKLLFVLLQRVLPHHLLSRATARLAETRVGWCKNLLIRIFIRIFRVDMAEAERERADDYANFNDFFTRTLRAGARRIEGTICSPADGTVSVSGLLRGKKALQAKGIIYSVSDLLGGEHGEDFEDGSFITVYLSPRDYHRVHMPISAALHRAVYLPGRLFSVNQVTTEAISDLFTGNERLVLHFETALGPMALVMVGAMIVAGVKPVWRDTPYAPATPFTEEFDGREFAQGDELGQFQLGSTVILLFDQPLDWQVASMDRVRMGQTLVE